MGLGRDGRGYVAEVGRCMVERRVRFAEEWWEGLRLHVEVWDGRDGLRMLSTEGPLEVQASHEATYLETGGLDRRELVGPAFSAASRDPEHHRFADMEEYFCRVHEEGVPGVLCARAVLRDVRSGRTALLWESGKGMRWGVIAMDPTDPVVPHLPPESFTVSLHPEKSRSVMFPACGDDPVQMWLDFIVRPEAGQEGLPAPDKLWRLAVEGDQGEEEEPFARLCVHNEDVDAVGRFVWSLLSL
jgi:hypothetical protein